MRKSHHQLGAAALIAFAAMGVLAALALDIPALGGLTLGLVWVSLAYLVGLRGRWLGALLWPLMMLVLCLSVGEALATWLDIPGTYLVLGALWPAALPLYLVAHGRSDTWIGPDV